MTLAVGLALNVAVLFAWPWLGGGRRALDPLYSWLCHRQPARFRRERHDPLQLDTREN